FIIWPNQQKALNIDNKYPDLAADLKAKAAKTAGQFSRINTFLSAPLLVAMTGAQTPGGQAVAPDPALAAGVRHADEDRGWASRFAPEDARKRLVALYALNHEIARTAETVRQAAIGDIRLQWWRDAAAEVFAGKIVRQHPVVQAFAEAHAETPF